MDTRTEQAVETTLQSELLTNERIFAHPTLGPVRMSRPTAEQERLIAEARRKQTHKDMRDPDVLAKDQLEKLATEKGMWSADMSDRITELTQKTGEAMGLLDSIGFKTFDGVLMDFQSTVVDLLDLYNEDESTKATISRYFDLAATPTNKDRQEIVDAAMSSKVDDLIEKGDTLRAQIDLLNEMFKVRKELNELQAKQTRVFLDSLESRADRAEELATIYYCCTSATTGAYLWPSATDIWHARPEVVETLMQEFHYFRHGITEEFRESMEKYGFTKRLNDTNASSDDSPAQPQSNSDGESLERTPEPSSSPTE